MSFVKKVKQSLMDTSLNVLNNADLQFVNKIQTGINLPLNVKKFYTISAITGLLYSG